MNKQYFHNMAFGTIIFLGAFLMFLIQPLIGKIVTPQYGGTSQVWCLCLLFFQLILLAGYFLTFLLSKTNAKTQGKLYLVILILSILLFNIPSGEGWIPDDLNHPVMNLLKQFIVYLLPPVLLLSTISTIMQKWYNFQTSNNPYFLYSISNLGSMSALLFYPLLVEPNFTVGETLNLWKQGFIILFIFAVIISLLMIFKNKLPTQDIKKLNDTNEKIPYVTMVYWVFLAACGSILLISFTNHIIHNIAPVPLFWIIPLAVYLLSFILSFADTKFYNRKFYVYLVFIILILNYIIYFTEILPNNLLVNTFLNLALLFDFCMICHGEIYESKPSPAKLPIFYLNIAFGGALGGIFVNLVAPIIFTQYIEYHLIQVIMVIFSTFLIYKFFPTKFINPKFKKAYIVILCVIFIFFGYFEIFSIDKSIITRQRNFYGIAKVNYSPKKDSIILVNGVTKHGLQLLDTTTGKLINLPTAYFGKDSGISIVNNLLRTMNPYKPLRYGIIGLGIGTIAVYGETGDKITFYDIDPKVVSIANKYFSFLNDSKAKINLVLEDGRLSIKKEKKHSFDLIVVDAFNSDSIPVHLLTDEAVKEYLNVIRSNGIILFHISNKFLDLKQVIANIAIKNGMNAYSIHTVNFDNNYLFNSDYVVLMKKCKSNKDIYYLNPYVKITKIEFDKKIGIWTDNYSSILSLLKIG